MKIAQFAPLYESVPPKYYGGTERIVSYLTEGLVRAGHEVTLFASGDSVTKAHLVAGCHRSLRLDKECIDRIAYYILLIEQVYRQASQFDIIHNHNDYFPFSLARRSDTPTLTTLHGRLDLKDLIPLLWFRSPMRSANLSPPLIGKGPFIMDCRRTSIPFMKGPVPIWLFWAGFLRKSAWTGRLKRLNAAG